MTQARFIMHLTDPPTGDRHTPQLVTDTPQLVTDIFSSLVLLTRFWSSVYGDSGSSRLGLAF